MEHPVFFTAETAPKAIYRPASTPNPRPAPMPAPMRAPVAGSPAIAPRPAPIPPPSIVPVMVPQLVNIDDVTRIPIPSLICFMMLAMVGVTSELRNRLC